MNVKKDKKPKFSTGNFSNSMTIDPTSKLILWRPNNYRRRMDLGYINIVHLERLKTAILKYPYLKVTYSSYNKLLWVLLDYKGGMFRLQLGRRFLVCVYVQNKVGGVKEVYKISLEGMERRKEEIRVLMDEVLVSFAKKWGLFDSKGEVKWLRHEDWIKGEEYIDRIPAEVVIHDTVFKKVYDEGVEFIGGEGVEPVARVKNYIKNRALEELSPELVSSINGLIERIDRGEVLSDPVGFLFSRGLNEWFNEQSRVVQDRFLFG